MALVRRVIDHTFTPETFYSWPQVVTGSLLHDIGTAYIDMYAMQMYIMHSRPAWIFGRFRISALLDAQSTMPKPIYPAYLAEKCGFNPTYICPSKGLIILSVNSDIDSSLYTSPQIILMKEIDLYSLAYLKEDDPAIKHDLIQAANQIWIGYGEQAFTPACREAVSAAARRAIYSPTS